MERKVINKIKTAVASRAESRLAAPNAAPHKLSLLFTIVNRQKAEFFTDFLQEYEINAQFTLSAYGTASTETLSALGLIPTDKAVIVSVIRNDKIPAALAGLEEKFRTVRGGKGVAFTSPMTSTVGVAVYQFLSNKGEGR